MESVHPLKKWISEHTTQAQFARDLAISESHLSEILSGGKTASLNLAIRLSRATKGAVPVEAFASQEAAE